LLRDFSPDLKHSHTSIKESIYHVRVLEGYSNLLHGISTRNAPDGADWNLSARRGSPQHPPSAEMALANRRKLAETLGIPIGQMVGCQQVHSSEVAIVGYKDAGRGMHPERPSIQGVDALATATPGLYLMALSADCPSVFFYDPVRRAIGLAHSGWKGTVGRIAANVVEAMVDNFGCEPSDIVVAVGPGIGPCCYSVGSNVVEQVESSFLHAWEPMADGLGLGVEELSNSPVLQERDGLTYFNLWEGIRRALLDAGISPQNLSIEAICTGHNLDLFYSHRMEQGECGLFGAVLGLREV